MTERSGPALSSRMTFVAIALAGISVVAAVLSGLGSRWGLWHFSFGFKVLMVSVFGGALSSVFALFGLILTFRKALWGKFIVSCTALALGITVFGIPFSWYFAAKQLPRIHDITTDTGNPPLFVAIIPLRKEAPNPSVYGGPDVAARQSEAYPDIKPLVLDISVDKAFDRALAAARKMSWVIVDVDLGQLRIEATDTTHWFGFKDDIVIRITPLDGRSRVDVRSVSRVGLSDVGTNAARIRRYLKTLTLLK